MPVNAAKILKQADDFLTQLEDSQLATVDRGLRLALRDLEKELKELYLDAETDVKDVKDQTFREKRARAILAQVKGLLKSFEYAVQGGKPKDGVPESMKAFIYGAYGEGIKSSALALQEYGVTNPLIVTPDTVAIQKVAQNSASRLVKHSQDFIDRAQTHIVAGLVRGKGYAAVSRGLAQETGLLRWKAERIVRTESISAMDEAKRAGYKKNGIKYVQRSAANDRRVCGYCAARHGRVYPIDNAPASIHPNDRCTNLPFRPEWVKDGLIDLKSWKDQREDLIKRLRAEGVDAPLEGVAPFEKMKGYKGPPQYMNLEKLAADPGSKLSIAPLPPEALKPTGPKLDPAITNLITDIRGLVKNYPGVWNGKLTKFQDLLDARRNAQDALKTKTLPSEQVDALKAAETALVDFMTVQAHKLYTIGIDYARSILDDDGDANFAKSELDDLEKDIADWGIEPTEAQAIKILQLKQDIASFGAAKLLAMAQQHIANSSPTLAIDAAAEVMGDPDATPLQLQLAQEIIDQALDLENQIAVQESRDQMLQGFAAVDVAIQAGNIPNAKEALKLVVAQHYEIVPELVKEYEAALKLRQDQIANLEQKQVLKGELFDLYNIAQDTVDEWTFVTDTFDKADDALNKIADIFTKVPSLQTDFAGNVAALVVQLNQAKTVAALIIDAQVQAGSGDYAYALDILEQALKVGPTFNQDGLILNLKLGYEDLAKSPTDPFDIATESAQNALGSGLYFAANSYVAQMKNLASTPAQEQLAHELDVKVFTGMNGYPPVWANPTPPTPASPGVPQTPNADPKVVQARMNLDAIKSQIHTAQVEMETMQTQYQQALGTKVKGSALIALLKQEGYVVAPADLAKLVNAWTGLKAKYAKAKKAYQKAQDDASAAPSGPVVAILDLDSLPGDTALNTAMKNIVGDQSSGYWGGAEGTFDNLIWEVSHGYMAEPTPEQAKVLKKLARKQDAATGSAYENVIPQGVGVTLTLSPSDKSKIEVKLNDASFFAGINNIGSAQSIMSEVATLVTGYTIPPDLSNLIAAVTGEIDDAVAKGNVPTKLKASEIQSVIKEIDLSIDNGDLDGAEKLIQSILLQDLTPGQKSKVDSYKQDLDALKAKSNPAATPPPSAIDGTIAAISEAIKDGNNHGAELLYLSTYADWTLGKFGTLTDPQTVAMMDIQDELGDKAGITVPSFLSGPPPPPGTTGLQSGFSLNILVQDLSEEAENAAKNGDFAQADALLAQAKGKLPGKIFPQFVLQSIDTAEAFITTQKSIAAPPPVTVPTSDTLTAAQEDTVMTLLGTATFNAGLDQTSAIDQYNQALNMVQGKTLSAIIMSEFKGAAKEILAAGDTVPLPGPPLPTTKKTKIYPSVDYSDPASVKERMKFHADQGDYVATSNVLTKAMTGASAATWGPHIADLSALLTKAKDGPPGMTPGQTSQYATLLQSYISAHTSAGAYMTTLAQKYGPQGNGDTKAWLDYLDWSGDPQEFTKLKVLAQNIADTANALQSFVKPLAPVGVVAPVSTVPAFPPSEAEVQASTLPDDVKAKIIQKIKGYTNAKEKLKTKLDEVKNSFGMDSTLGPLEVLVALDFQLGNSSMTYQAVQASINLAEKSQKALEDVLSDTGYTNTGNPPPVVPGPSGTLPTAPPSPVPFVLSPVPKGGSKKFESILIDANVKAQVGNWVGVAIELAKASKLKPNAAQMDKYQELFDIAKSKGFDIDQLPTPPSGWAKSTPATTATATAAATAGLPPAAAAAMGPVNSPIFNEAITVFDAGAAPPAGEVLMLHGVAFGELATEPDWKAIPDKAIPEPPQPSIPGKWNSSGIIVMEDDGRVWVYEPTGHYNGVEHTYPKGKIEPDLTSQQNALKELYEEAGLTAEITGYLGDYTGSASTTRYYIAKRTGGAPWKPSAGGGVLETQSVKLATLEELDGLLNQSRDKQILADLKKHQIANPPPVKFVPQAPPPPPPRAIPAPLLVQEKTKRDQKAVDFPASLDGFEDTGKRLGGSTGAKLVRDKKTGKQFIMKRGGGADPSGHLREEMFADAAYQAMGVAVPAFKEYTDPDGKPVKVAEFIEGTVLGQLSGSERAEAEAQYLKFWAADVAMGNWDVIGASADNVLWDRKTKTLYRIDNGGSFRSKAMGGSKSLDPNDPLGSWSQFPAELWTLRQSKAVQGTSKNSQVGPLAGRLSWSEISDQLIYLARHRDAILAEVPNEIKDTLKARIDTMGDFGLQGRAMIDDSWDADHTERMTYHRLKLKQAGLSAKLPQKFGKPTKNSSGKRTTVKDEKGKVFDDLRGSTGIMRDLVKYFADQGLGGSERFFSNWMEDQSHDSWTTEGARAMKYLLVKFRPGTEGKYFWMGGIDNSKQSYDTVSRRFGGKEKVEAGLDIWRAFQYELLTQVQMHGNDPLTRTVRLIRSESKSITDRNNLKLGDTDTVFMKGPNESTSLYDEFYFKGEELFSYDVPYHRVMGTYLHSQMDNSEDAFLGDGENEVSAMLEGLPGDYISTQRGGKRAANYKNMRVMGADLP